MNGEEQTTTEQNMPNQQRTCHINQQQLPLHCPLPDMSLWDSHPRVYLPIEETGRATCPYCGSEYVLDDN
jgi:uncharacterized Zn-finger protein